MKTRIIDCVRPVFVVLSALLLAASCRPTCGASEGAGPAETTTTESEPAEDAIAELIGAIDSRLHPDDAAWRLRRVTHRTARLTVLEQKADARAGAVTTRVRFVEVDGEGKSIGEPREFEVPARRIYIRARFYPLDPRHYRQESGLYPGTCVCLFDRYYHPALAPIKGPRLDQPNSVPPPYRGKGQPTPLEEAVWNDIWNDKAAVMPDDLPTAHGAFFDLEPNTAVEIVIRPLRPIAVKEIPPAAR